eukprot:CAMPEP_0168380846 /NCGR_PEP_ID=MMETSP0228-20121227/12571_1 /TAXON_ID=133427 /ORGANISM="Protoceratium reticulatum, Strain CCCM 535 (=CCMP 1889)" /LENGTH=656 /DNA_ID=CAMNT_0008393925 /DNA_START=30 /DNA_END=1997 /DNA_ORIENTATION=-
MEATFGEGECAAVLVMEAFTIAEVAKWPSGQHAGEGLSRSYLVRVSTDGFETRKHFEVYKIHATPVASTSNELMRLEDVQGVKDAGPDGAGEGKGDDDKKRIKEVKSYLHEMGKMPATDYKAVMRRLFKTWHPDKVGDTPLANSIFRLLRQHEQWYKKHLAGEAGDDSWLDDEQEIFVGETGASAPADDTIKALLPRVYESTPGVQGSWFDEFESELKQAEHVRAAKCKSMARPPDSTTPQQQDSWENNGSAQASSSVRKRIVDRAQAPRWLQQAKLELVAARRLLQPIDGLRSLPATAVWHCQQVVEMATKSAMFRTCGVAEDEVMGGSAHDIADFAKRLSGGVVNTEEQRRAQRVPCDDDTMDWLKRAYLAARYPKPGRYGIPGLQYTTADSDRAMRLAEDFVKWAAHVEDLPDMLTDNRPGNDAVLEDIRKRRWSSVAEAAGLPDAEVNQMRPTPATQEAGAASPAPPASKASSAASKASSAASKASSAASKPSSAVSKASSDGGTAAAAAPGVRVVDGGAAGTVPSKAAVPPGNGTATGSATSATTSTKDDVPSEAAASAQGSATGNTTTAAPPPVAGGSSPANDRVPGNASTGSGAAGGTSASAALKPEPVAQQATSNGATSQSEPAVKQARTTPAEGGAEAAGPKPPPPA